MKRLVFLLAVLFIFPAFGSEEHPLLPADTSSPRATLNSFMENCETAYNLLQKEGRSTENEQKVLETRQAVRRIMRCMDLSET